MFATEGLEEALVLLGQLLAERSQSFEVVAIGGGGLLLIGVIDRPTKDLDLVALVEDNTLIPATKPLPTALAEAASDVARALGLSDDWINGGPTSMLRFGLPDGFRDRLEHRVYGGLRIALASRFDQIHFKLHAAADDRPGGKHHIDLKKLKPTHDELIIAARWTRTHDPSEGFATILAGVLKAFGVEAEAS